jgi:hypothetical protein
MYRTIYRSHHLGQTSGKRRSKITYQSNSLRLTHRIRCLGTLTDPALQGWHLVTDLSRQPVGRIFKAWFLKLRPKGCSKTSVTNHHPTLVDIPEQRILQLNSGKSLISRRFVVAFSVRLGQARSSFHVVRASSVKFGLYAGQHEISVPPRNSKYTYV